MNPFVYLKNSLWAKAAFIVVSVVFFRQFPDFLEWPIILSAIVLAALALAQLLFRDYRQNTWSCVRRSFSHPVAFLIGLVLLCLATRESYPFSHFPMYGDPSPTSEYYYIGSVERPGPGGIVPLPIQTLTKVSSAKTGKMFRARRDAYCKEHSRNREDLTEEDYRAIGEGLLVFLYEKGQKLALAPLPEQWALLHVGISHSSDTGFKEETHVLATKSFSG